MPPKRERQLAFLLAAVFVLVFLCRGAERLGQRDLNDFHAYYKGALAFRSGGPLYEDREEPVFKYSPFFALAFVPLTFLGEGTAFVVWIVLSIVQLFVILIWSRELLDAKVVGQLGPPRVWVYVCAFLPVLAFFISDMDHGQANTFTLFWATGSLRQLQKGRPGRAGISLAAAILSKVGAVLFMPFLWVRGYRRAMLWSVAWVMLLSLLPWPFQGGPAGGLRCLRAWYISTGQRHDSDYLASCTNQSLTGAFYRSFSRRERPFDVDHGFGGPLYVPSNELKRLQWLVGLLLYLVLLPRPRDSVLMERWRLKPSGVDFSLLMVVTTILFPMAWKYYYVSLLMPCMLVYLYLYRVGWRDPSVRNLFAAFIFLAVLMPYFPVRTWRLNALYYSTMVWGALALVAALWDIKRHPLRFTVTIIGVSAVVFTCGAALFPFFMFYILTGPLRFIVQFIQHALHPKDKTVNDEESEMTSVDV